MVQGHGGAMIPATVSNHGASRHTPQQGVLVS
jgi:hypothetical protein